jgi:hypothetical protein
VCFPYISPVMCAVVRACVRVRCECVRRDTFVGDPEVRVVENAVEVGSRHDEARGIEAPQEVRRHLHATVWHVSPNKFGLHKAKNEE